MNLDTSGRIIYNPLPVFGPWENYMVFIMAICAITYYFFRDFKKAICLSLNIIVPFLLVLLQAYWYFFYYEPINPYIRENLNISDVFIRLIILYIYYWFHHFIGLFIGAGALINHKFNLNHKYHSQFKFTLPIMLFGFYWVYITTTHNL